MILCKGTPDSRGKGGGHPKLWAFGYGSLAKLLGISEHAARQLVHRRRFNPLDLESLIEYASKRRGEK